MDEQTYMKERAILPLVFSMAIPMVLSMAVNAAYNVVDSYFVAKIDEDAMTALSLIFPIQNLSSAIAIGFGVGSCSAISIALGAGKRDEAARAAGLGYMLSFLHGVLFVIAAVVATKPFLRMFTDSEKLIQYGYEYIFIVFLFAPVLHMSMHAEKVVQSAGHMKQTMLGMLMGCIFNIIMDPVLIFGLGPFPAMGIKGAALATGLGQTIALLAYVGFSLAKSMPMRAKLEECVNPALLVADISLKDSKVKCIYSVGIPATLNLALPSLKVSVLNAILSGFSASFVLVLGAYCKLQTFLYLSANGIIQGIRPIVGYNYGAGEYGRVKQTQNVTFVMCIIIMAVGTLLCQLCPDKLIGLFTENVDTIINGITALRIISLGFIMSAVSVTISGVLEGIGRGHSSLIISLCRYIVITLPVAFILSRFLGANGVWHAFWITELVAAIVSLKLRPIK